MFLAFGILAAVTVVTSLLAWAAYERLGHSVQQIAHQDVTAISLAAELAQKGGAITATAPALVAAPNINRLKADWQVLIRTIREMETLVGRIYPGEAEQDVLAERKKLLSAVEVNVRELDAIVRRRFWFAARNQELSDRLRWAHADMLDEVEPLIDDARFGINLALEKDQAGQNDTGQPEIKIAQQTALLRIEAAGNLLVGLIARAATISDKDTLQDTRHFAQEIATPVSNDFKPLKQISGSLSLRQAFASIMSYVEGDNSLFDLRRDELELEEKAQALLAENRRLVQKLQTEIAAHVSAVNKQAQNAAVQSADYIGRTKWILVTASVGSVIIAILAVWLYVGRNIVGRITALDSSMREIAKGDLQAEVPLGGSDEIGEMADALKTFRDTLSQTQAELVQAGKLAALGQLTAGIAHELNQPLAAIRSRVHSTRVLLERREEDSAKENLDVISSVSARMADKIRHLKALARKPSTEIKPFELKSVIAGALDIMHSRIHEQGVKVINRLPDDDVFARGGAIRLEQVLLNVIGNALDAMKGRPKQTLTIALDRQDDQFVVSVRDTGSGIDPKHLEQIFDPFFTTKEVGEGLGLGLSISYNIMTDLGGSLRVKSEPGQGTTFFISIDCAAETVSA